MNWIKVTDAVPEEWKDVLIHDVPDDYEDVHCDSACYYTVARFDREQNYFETLQPDTLGFLDWKEHYCEVIAWMEFPEYNLE